MRSESNIYRRRVIWKLALLSLAVFIGLGSLLFTDRLIDQLKEEEKEIVRHWAEATSLIDTYEDDQILAFLFSIIEKNNAIPVILVDSEGKIKDHRNFNPTKASNPGYLEEQLRKIKAKTDPIIIEIGNGERDYIYYKESTILTKLMYYPYIQLFVIMMFISISYFAFSMSRKAEQNQVWVGMSKETAHQLGTPTSSLAGWAELIKDQYPESNIPDELAMDVQRLEKITERFSKIGSQPELKEEDLAGVLARSIEYLRLRSGPRVEIEIDNSNNEIILPLNTVLFEWVIENLCKNSIDAMNGSGKILIKVTSGQDKVILDVSDTGKGIPKSAQKRIFKPGYTTKQRGWGLGLSLAKRIVEIYHAGKIFVRHSDQGRGTTIRIVLPLHKK